MSRRGTKPTAASNPLPGPESAKESASSTKQSEAGATSARETSATGYARLLELALFLGCLVYANVFWLRLPGQLPDEKDYLALQAAIRSEIQPGDGAAVLPFWADRAKLFLHGTPVLALTHLETEADAERYARLWVIAQPELPHSDARETLNALSQRLTPVKGPQRFGPLELWLFTPRPGRASSYDFVAHAGDARIQSPMPLRTEWREFDFLPRHCLLSQAGQAVLHYDGVPVHNGLRVGLGSLGPRGEAQIQASVDGRPLQPLHLTDPGAGFQEAELAAGGLTGDTHSVDLTLLGRGVCADAVAF